VCCAAVGLLGRTWRPAYAATPASATPSEEAANVEMRPVQVAEGAWFVQGQAAPRLGGQPELHLQRRLRRHAAGVVVIDALGSPPLARRLLAEIARSRRSQCAT
jgi:hypothetical protein